MATKAKKSGSKSKTKAKPAAERPDPAVSVTRHISERQLKDVIRVADQCQSRASAASGELGQVIRDYKEKGLNPIAFRMVARLRRKGQRDPVGLRADLEAFDLYRDMIKLDDMAAADMFLDEGGKRKSKTRTAKAPEAEPEATEEQVDLEDAIAETGEGVEEHRTVM